LAIVANLRNSASSSQAVTLLSSLTGSQSVDGSWGDDIYATALVARSLAAGMARDLSAQQQPVNMPDAALRTAVNHALGRNAMDALNVGELAQLTALTAAGLGIGDLTGLQYATNLTYLDLRNNNINSFTPVATLASATILEDGNPGYVASGGGANSGDVPTLPEWGAILLGGLLLFNVAWSQKRQRRAHKAPTRKDTL
jgi:Leucine-rich repeat (LRR) protein